MLSSAVTIWGGEQRKAANITDLEEPRDNSQDTK